MPTASPAEPSPSPLTLSRLTRERSMQKGMRAENPEDRDTLWRREQKSKEERAMRVKSDPPKLAHGLFLLRLTLASLSSLLFPCDTPLPVDIPRVVDDASRHEQDLSPPRLVCTSHPSCRDRLTLSPTLAIRVLSSISLLSCSPPLHPHPLCRLPSPVTLFLSSPTHSTSPRLRTSSFLCLVCPCLFQCLACHSVQHPFPFHLWTGKHRH